MTPIDPTMGPGRAAPADALHRQAVRLEALMFAQMMKASGTGPPSFGGRGSAFDDFLITAQAEAVAGSGQTGLARVLARSLGGV